PSTYTWVLAIGRPMGTIREGSCLTHLHHVTSMDASVGPYRLKSSAWLAAKKRSQSSNDSASPLQITRIRQAHTSTPGASRNADSIEGTKCTVVTLSVAIRRARYAGSRCPFGRATTSRAPTISGQKNSQTETSKA